MLAHIARRAVGGNGVIEIDAAGEPMNFAEMSCCSSSSAQKS